ncbi:MAG TPA: ABC transporter permease [Longimicrobiales bacterium]|nr:ABC transporter permease [Longimicrobiales bacterium]
MRDVIQQVRLVARSLVRDRAFTAVAVALLSIGIAANVTIFGVVDAVLLQPLPYAAPDALVHVAETNPDGLEFSMSEPNYIDFVESQRSFVSMAAIRQANLDLTGEGDPARLRGQEVTASFFDVLGTPAAAGRVFAAEDGVGVVVLSHTLWMERFGGDAAVIGSSIALSGREHTIIGVMPAPFEFGETELWVPFIPERASDRGNHWLDVIGRLRPGVGREAAEADLAAVSMQIAAAHPAIAGWGVQVDDLREWFVGSDTARGMWVLMVAVGLLLLLACANVGNLFLARGSARQAELAVRAAMGAGRATLVRQLWLEAALISAAGGAIGLLLTTWSFDVIGLLAGARIPGLDEMVLNIRHVAFAVLLAGFTSLLFGVLPALRASSVDIQSLLRSGARSVAGNRGRLVRDGLVVTQVALAMVLLLGSALLLRSFLAIRASATGLDVEGLHAVPLELTSSRYGADGSISIFYQNLTERINAIPGVTAAGAATTHPFVNWRLVNDVTPVDRAAVTPASGFMQADWRVATTDYFDAARVRLLRGRLFETTDMYYNPRVAVVTRTFAERMWPGRNAVGRSFYWGGTSGDPIEVIGVVEDVRDMELAAPAPPMMFLSTRQMSMPMMTLLVRTSGDVPGLAEAIRREVWALDRTVPVPLIERVSQDRAAAMAEPRIRAALLAVFAICALLVACIGVYAVVAFQVANRTRELGIRAALGARPLSLLRLVLARGAALVGAGIVIGLGAALAFTRLLQALLYETAAHDPLTFTLVPALLAFVALLAAYMPARRSSRVDPVRALRAD